MKMASSFPDPSKAEECFQKLNDMKDNNIFNMLELLVNDLQHINAQTIRVRCFLFLKGVFFQFIMNCNWKWKGSEKERRGMGKGINYLIQVCTCLLGTRIASYSRSKHINGREKGNAPFTFFPFMHLQAIIILLPQVCLLSLYRSLNE